MRHSHLIVRAFTALALLALIGLIHPAGVRAGAPPHRLDRNLGWVLSNPSVYNLFWDNHWNADNPPFTIQNINNATSSLLGSGYLSGAGQYGVGNGSFAGWHDTGGSVGWFCGPRRAPNTVHFATILAWLTCKVATPFSGVPYPSFRLPVSNTLYVVYLPSNTTIDDNLSIPAINVLGQHIGPITIVNKQSCRDYTGYHSFSFGVTSFFAYAIIATRCPATDRGGLNEVTQLASHEIVEAATNPFNLLSWWDDSISLGDRFLYGEAADICSAGAVPTPSVMLASGVSVSPYWSNADNRCVAGDDYHPLPTPRVSVDGQPLPLGVPVTTRIEASDPNSQTPPVGTATIHNFDAQGQPVVLQVPTNTPFTTTFHTGMSKTRDCVDAPKPHCFWVTEVVYPDGTVSLPGYASVEIPFRFTDPTPHRLLAQVDPSSVLPGGRPVSVTVRSVDATTLVPVAGRVVLNGQDVGPTNTPFTTTFTAPPSGFVRAAGYQDTPISWPSYQPSHLQVSATLFPPPLKQSVSLTISARNADSAAHEAVAGIATIHNYDAQGNPVLLQIPTNTPATVTFYAHVTRTRECDGGGGGPVQKPHCWWITQTDYPTGTVSAPGFQDEAIDFGFPASEES